MLAKGSKGKRKYRHAAITDRFGRSQSIKAYNGFLASLSAVSHMLADIRQAAP